MTRQLKFPALAVSFAFAWFGVAAFAAAPPSGGTNSTAKRKSTHPAISDSDFAKAAAEGGFAEVKFGELAEDKASSKTVRDLGQRMVDDHTAADNHLKEAASKENISIPAQLNAKDQAAYARLSELSGAAFDRAYTRDMVRDHETDVVLFRQEADDGKDATIKSFAAKTLPTLEEHLKLARTAEQNVLTKTTSQTSKKQS